jgi:hypothetical protein
MSRNSALQVTGDVKDPGLDLVKISFRYYQLTPTHHHLKPLTETTASAKKALLAYITIDPLPTHNVALHPHETG